MVSVWQPELWICECEIEVGSPNPWYSPNLEKKQAFFTSLNKFALNYAKECRNHSKLLTNRKLWFFWFETVLQLFFNSENKNIFSVEKNSGKIFGKFRKVFEILKNQKNKMKNHMIFIWFFIDNFRLFWFKKKMSVFFGFFSSSEIFIFIRSQKMFWITIPIQNCMLFRMVIFLEWLRHSFLTNECFEMCIRFFSHYCLNPEPVLRMHSIVTVPDMPRDKSEQSVEENS